MLNAPASAVNAVINNWAAKHPGLRARLHRAVALLDNVRPGDRSPNVFFIEGSYGNKYMVRVNRAQKSSSCNCPDHQNRNVKCKHILAAALYERLSKN